MAIGGETTGWMLIFHDGGKTANIEVDMMGIAKVKGLDGKEVTITGTIVKQQYVERGAVLILKAKSVK